MTANPGSVCALLIRDGLVCAVSRRNKPDDRGLPGGKIEPGELASEAMVREVQEEVGVRPLAYQYVFERVDETDGNVAWCYLVRRWEGEPRQCEAGITVSWVEPARLLDPGCTFREYNRKLFEALGL
jgi:mutator protein MutT